MNLNILYEDTHLIVCIKPAGTPTQSSRIGTPDMVSILKNHLHRQNPNAGEPYLAIIHRLDQPVEGILVFAKTPFAAKELSRQLQSKGFGKHYYALLNGRPAIDSQTVEDYLVKNGRTNTSDVCDKGTNGGKLARLSYRILSDSTSKTFPVNPEFIPNSVNDGISSDALPTVPLISLAEITLDTGRHHQIRVQMAHLGCPLIGDSKYGISRCPSQLALCAYRLEFMHPKTKKKLAFQCQPTFLLS
ncbi:MAG: RluA family pseudouridine synthase [Hespellia sp.]|nr:RluA family pseudouridine synthase [Hespellia sp.]